MRLALTAVSRTFRSRCAALGNETGSGGVRTAGGRPAPRPLQPRFPSSTSRLRLTETGSSAGAEPAGCLAPALAPWFPNGRTGQQTLQGRPLHVAAAPRSRGSVVPAVTPPAWGRRAPQGAGCTGDSSAPGTGPGQGSTRRQRGRQSGRSAPRALPWGRALPGRPGTLLGKKAVLRTRDGALSPPGLAAPEAAAPAQSRRFTRHPPPPQSRVFLPHGLASSGSF